MTDRRRGIVGVLCLFWLCQAAHGCSRSDEVARPVDAASPTQAPSPADLPAPVGQAVGIEFRSEPSPPASGDNALEVVVTQPDGSPVTDATVEVVFSMPAMPSMNMPAMRSVATLQHQTSGHYRGSGRLSMSGTWNVIVTVSRGTEELNRRTFSVVAK